MFGTRKLGRTSDQRKAMLRAMTTYLLENGKMETTFTRAKEVQPVVEKMITLGKKNGLANYRKALSYITKEDVANKLFKEIAPKYADRNGATPASPASARAAATPPRWPSSNCSDSVPEKRISPSAHGRGGSFFVWTRTHGCDRIRKKKLEVTTWPEGRKNQPGACRCGCTC